jgi:hypothetical protein
MTQESQPSPEDVAASFVAHIKEFHRSLPAEEQQLLEQVFSLAERGQGTDDDAAGYTSSALPTLFARGLITEIGFPALDASSKDAAKMTLRFQPETT